jgi:xanthine/uracil/vitamin C permease (AzgA family)
MQGLLLLVLGATNAIELVNRLVPRSVVSGLQMGVGCSLALRGLDLVAPLPWWILDGRCTAVTSAVLAMYLMSEANKAGRHCQLPVGIVLFGICTVIAVIQIAGGDTGFAWQTAPVAEVSLRGAQWGDWMTGLWQGAIPQLPLSTLNTVISTCCLAETLFPGKDDLPTRRQMAISVGLMNILLCPFGALPCCNGAGGLAGQHKFGTCET